MTNWQEVRLDDICKINTETYSLDENLKYVNYLDTGNITSNRIENIQYIDLYVDKLPSRARRKVKNGNIIYSTVRPNQLHYGLIKEQPDNFLVSTGFAVLDIDTTKAIPEYVYYSLTKTIHTEALQAIAEQSTSAYPSIKSSDIGNRIIPLPPLDVQKKIAGVLGALDDKIELNNKINNNLEQQAQALFNEKILNNPKQGCIGDYCSIKSGFAFKSSWWQDVGVRVIKIKNIESSELNLHECSYVSEDKISIAKDFVVKGGDLLIAMTGATIGKFAIVPHVDEILLVNQRVGKFFLGDNPLEKLPFIYCTLKQPEVVSEIINRGQGSAQPNISGNDIMSITCTYPDENIIANFNNICRLYFEKIIMNQYENTRLSALRDALLPKLMSGEVDVSKVDISALTSTDKLSFRK